MQKDTLVTCALWTSCQVSPDDVRLCAAWPLAERDTWLVAPLPMPAPPVLLGSAHLLSRALPECPSDSSRTTVASPPSVPALTCLLRGLLVLCGVPRPGRVLQELNDWDQVVLSKFLKQTSKCTYTLGPGLGGRWGEFKRLLTTRILK